MGGVFNVGWDVGDKRFNNTVYGSRNVLRRAGTTNAMGVLVKLL